MLRDGAHMIEVAVTDNHVLDLRRIEAERLQSDDDFILVLDNIQVLE